ncbi:MAG: uroporphyrinogen-III synthase [Acidobacteriota bacterium]|nr:uroporphyrinogen-III synthase [Acidobacteriota bacterium]
MADLGGAKIVLLEARMNSELANLVRRHGGEPVSVPAVREVTMDCSAEVAALIDGSSVGEIDFIVFQTGVGLMTLLGEAEKLGRKEELLAALRRTTIIARGPKPTAVLSRNGLKPNVATKEPFTTSDLLEAMQPLDPESGRREPYGSRPPTPPDMRFRIRRFVKLLPRRD